MQRIRNPQNPAHLRGGAPSQDLQDQLFEYIAHGDKSHREWLREAIAAFFAGKPRPAPR